MFELLKDRFTEIERIALSVAVLDGIKKKLHAKCPDSETAGSQLPEEILEHSQNEFRWQKVITVLEDPLGIASQEKSNAYDKARLSKTILQRR